jgi:hypothetical protein
MVVCPLVIRDGGGLSNTTNMATTTTTTTAATTTASVTITATATTTISASVTITATATTTTTTTSYVENSLFVNKQSTNSLSELIRFSYKKTCQ